jgi:hypothetical protein
VNVNEDMKIFHIKFRDMLVFFPPYQISCAKAVNVISGVVIILLFILPVLINLSSKVI